MNIIHINRNYITSTVHETMLGFLEKRGIKGTVFVPMDVNKKIKIKLKPNENVILKECVTKLDRFFFYKKQKKIFATLDETVHLGEYDIVHAYTLFTDGNCAMQVAKKYGLPYMITIRSSDLHFLKYMPHLRSRALNILKNANRVFFLSVSYKNLVLEKYISAEERDAIDKKSVIIPNGIDDFWLINGQREADTAHRERIEKRELRLVYAGRIHKSKNITSVTRAMDILKKKNWDVTLQIVGKVEDQRELKALTSHGKVTYHNPCDRETLVHMYRDNDIFVMPSYMETFGLVYAEAMSQGLPVIYTKGQGFDGQFSEGEVGYSVDPRSPEDIANKIVYVIQNYEVLSMNCREKYKKFDWNRIVKEYETIYSEIRPGV